MGGATARCRTQKDVFGKYHGWSPIPCLPGPGRVKPPEDESDHGIHVHLPLHTEHLRAWNTQAHPSEPCVSPIGLLCWGIHIQLWLINYEDSTESLGTQLSKPTASFSPGLQVWSPAQMLSGSPQGTLSHFLLPFILPSLALRSNSRSPLQDGAGQSSASVCLCANGHWLH